MATVRLEPAAIQSRVKHSTTEPLPSHSHKHEIVIFINSKIQVSQCSCSEPQIIMPFDLIMNFKMPTIVGILKFMTRTNLTGNNKT